MNNLTVKQIDGAKAKAKEYTLSDGAGMVLTVSKTGAKYFHMRYRFGGKAIKKSLGVYPYLGLKEARAKRDELKKSIANGIDPYAEAKDEREAEALAVAHSKDFEAWSEYYFDKVQGSVSDTHLSRVKKGFVKDVFPALKGIPMNDIMPRDIISILHKMEKRGAKASAKKVFGSISKMFKVCISNYPDEVTSNPCRDIEFKEVVNVPSPVNYPVITDERDLGILLTRINEYDGHSSTRLGLALIFRLALRPKNIRRLKWDMVDTKEKQIVIPASEMKTNSELIVPLSDEVLALLEEAKLHSGHSVFVLPSIRSMGQPMSDNALVTGLRTMGYKREDIVAHSARGIFSTILHEKGDFRHEVIETQLSHSVGSSVSKAYNRALYLDDRVEMMKAWSSYLEKVIAVASDEKVA